MNNKQVVVLWIGAAILVATWLLPPWIMHNGPKSENLGYRFLFTWGQQGGPLALYFHTIDWGRLLLADLAIITIGALLVFTLRSPR